MHRRTGKTHAAYCLLVEAAITKPGRYVVCVPREGRPRQHAFDRVHNLLKTSGQISNAYPTRFMAELRNGSTVSVHVCPTPRDPSDGATGVFYP